MWWRAKQDEGGTLPARPHVRPRWTRGRAILGLCAVLLTVGLAAWIPEASTPASPYLGPLTGDVPEQGLFPFQRAYPVLRTGRKVEVLDFETMWDMWSATDRWVIVKALDQFGAWSGLTQGATTVPSLPLTRQHVTGGIMVMYGPPVPTYDWSHARYRSPYVSIAHYALQVRPASPLRRLPPRLQKLLERYSHVNQSYAYGGSFSKWPVLSAGGYAMHGGLMSPLADNYVVSAPGGAGNGGRAPADTTFAGLQKELRQGQVSSSGGVNDFNASVNVMIALVCHADGRRPAKACRRPAIRMLLKRIR